ncbi:MAG: TonB-dependent receptor, partial [Candidatus Omnitrophica bacterium]|nr:TonB-dependent receptor [Candidatus Omnitrophota bacterium]
RPLAQPSQIIIHVRMGDSENVREQEALGIMGVNLIYGAFYFYEQPEILIESLMDNLTRDRIEVDMIKFSGPDFASVDNRLMSLQLVQQGLTNSAMFLANGEVVQPAEVLYNKPILIERGSFRPVNLLNMDMLECARLQFMQEGQVRDQEVSILMEITMHNLLSTAALDHRDFLARVDLLGALGMTVLISNYSLFYRLAMHLSEYTKKMIGIVIGVPALIEILNEKYYGDLEGGILESFGRLFRNANRLYVYPYLERSGQLVSANSLEVPSHLRHLYDHLLG